MSTLDSCLLVGSLFVLAILVVRAILINLGKWDVMVPPDYRSSTTHAPPPKPNDPIGDYVQSLDMDF